MKPILMNFPMPITTEHLIIRPPSMGDGIKINQAILETYDQLKAIMPAEPQLELQFNTANRQEIKMTESLAKSAQSVQTALEKKA